MPLQWCNQIWQSLEEGARMRSECESASEICERTLRNLAAIASAGYPLSGSVLACNTNRFEQFGCVCAFRHILQTEGVRGLFKGIGPNLVGVAPSRSVATLPHLLSSVFSRFKITSLSHQRN